MIDHVYVVLVVDDLGDIRVSVYEHRVQAIFEAVLAADRGLGDNYTSLSIPEQVRLNGLDLVFKAKHGPANVTVMRRVPK